MRYGSLCSGIEAATTAWHTIGWEPAWFSEIDPFCCSLLKQHYPSVPNLGDMTKITEQELANHGRIDLLVAGTPCQSFSIAGRREGLADARGNLSLRFCDIADATGPSWIVWENVPGVLSSKDNAFGCLLGALSGEDDPIIPAGPKWTHAGCVFGPKRTVAWRVLDAQYFGLAQRRKRVFVVASAGCDSAIEILFESEGLRRDLAPCREKGEEVAGTLESRTTAGGFPGTDGACMNHVVACFDPNQITSKTNKSRITPGLCHTLPSTQNSPIAFFCKDSGQDAGCISPTLRSMGHSSSKANGGAIVVRRLTPAECERLQGFPDNHTLVTHRKKLAADGPRYKAIGNSMAVPVMNWIGKRIQAHKEKM